MSVKAIRGAFVSLVNKFKVNMCNKLGKTFVKKIQSAQV